MMMIKRLAGALVAALALASVAFAADKPLVIESGQVKQIPAATSLQLQAPTTANATINLPHGTAPTSPTNGDCWTTTAGLYCRINGSTVGPYSTGGVTTTGSPASGNLTKFSGSNTITNGDLSGDVTTAGTLATTLANSGVTAGSYGSSTAIPVLTVDAKGRVTGVSTTTVTGGGGGGAGCAVVVCTINDLTFWWESDDLIGTNNRTVRVLRDRTPWYAAATTDSNSGIGAFFTNALTLNGLPVISMDGSGNVGFKAAPTFGSAQTVIAIVRFNSFSTQNFLVTGLSNSLEFRVTSGASPHFQLEKNFVATIATDTTTLSTNTWYKVAFSYDQSGPYAFRINGSASSSGTASTTITGGGLCFFYNCGSAGGGNMNGYAAAVIVYNRALTTTEIQSVESYLSSKWGV